MNDVPDPAFDTYHPSGALLFRSTRGGCLHSIALSEDAMAADANSLAEAIRRTARVSFLKATVTLRAEIVAAHPTEGAQAMPTATDLENAIGVLNSHQLEYRQDG